jgi:nicotinamide riboside kinase
MYSGAYKSPFKIAVCGSHSSGKTTLISLMKDAVSSLLVIGGVVRHLVDSGYHYGMQTDATAIMKYITCQFAEEDIAEREHPRVIVSDRVILDGLAYVTANQGVTGRAQWSDVPFEFLHSLASRHIRSYDLLVYVPVEFGLVEDEYRPAEVEYQLEVDLALQKVIGDLVSIPVVRVTGEPTQRLEQVLRIIEGVVT